MPLSARVFSVCSVYVFFSPEHGVSEPLGPPKSLRSQWAGMGIFTGALRVHCAPPLKGKGAPDRGSAGIREARVKAGRAQRGGRGPWQWG